MTMSATFPAVAAGTRPGCGECVTTLSGRRGCSHGRVGRLLAEIRRVEVARVQRAVGTRHLHRRAVDEQTYGRRPRLGRSEHDLSQRDRLLLGADVAESAGEVDGHGAAGPAD